MNNFNKALERVDESLRDWFKPHRDKRTGKKFKGWVNCRTGGPCSSKSKGGKYPVCRPTHAQCKPIKHKMHKKKGHARVQWKENLNENYFPVRTSFADLPSTAPYGFWVWGNKYVVANYMDDHIKILREIMPSEYQRLGDSSLQTKAYGLGLIRVVKEGPTYHIDYTKASPTALKLIHDIAEFYGKTVSDPFKQSSTLPVSPDSTLESIGIFKEHFFRTAAGDQRVTDTSATAEAIYADGQDSTVPAVQTLTDQTGKESVIQDIIRDLEDLKVNHNWNTKLDDDLIRAMADTLEGIGVEPTDMYAAIGADARRQKQYLITGPSSWKGGNGALNDLKAILAGNEPQEIEEDESVPSSDLPYGSADSNPGMADLSEMNRRDFIKKIGRAAAVTGVAPGAMGKIAMNVATGGASFNLTKAISDHLMNNVPMFTGNPFEGYAANSMSEIVDTAEGISSSYSPVVNALQGSRVSFPPHLATLARAIFDQVNAVKDMSEYSKLHPDEIPEDAAIEEGENMLGDIFDPDGVIYDFNKELMDFGFKTNRITPEAQKYLEDNYDIYKCDFVKDPASEARRNEKEMQGQRDYHQYQQKQTAPDINYSRMDTKGGAEDIGYKNTVDENFMDGKGPGRPGDSKRHGIKKKASLSSLDKIVKSKTASPRKKQLAHWQANMRRGKAKKKR